MNNLIKRFNKEINSFKKALIEVISSPHPKFLLIAIIVFVISFLYGISGDIDLIHAYSDLKSKLFKTEVVIEKKPTIPNKRIIELPNLKNTVTPTTKPIVNYPTSTPDPDPIITCNMHINCGGGTKQLRKSVCEQSTCCEIGNSWTFYEDKNKCTQDQNSYYSNSNNPPQFEGSNNSSEYETNNSYVPEYIPTPTSDFDRSIYVDQCYKNAVATINGECNSKKDSNNLNQDYGCTEAGKSQRYAQARDNCERSVQ